MVNFDIIQIYLGRLLMFHQISLEHLVFGILLCIILFFFKKKIPSLKIGFRKAKYFYGECFHIPLSWC